MVLDAVDRRVTTDINEKLTGAFTGTETLSFVQLSASLTYF